MSLVDKIYVSYNDVRGFASAFVDSASARANGQIKVHKLCQQQAKKILEQFQPNVIIAIGGGGFIPARILRTFLKRPSDKNIPIQAIGLTLYEDTYVDDPHASEKLGKEVVRTQWLDFSALSTITLVGKNILIVDEVDDTRTTLNYAVRELAKDIENQTREHGRCDTKTVFGVFVIHNKEKTKHAELPEDILASRYFIGETVRDVWIEYPWEQLDIDAHDKNVLAMKNKTLA